MLFALKTFMRALVFVLTYAHKFNPLSANPTKWSNTLKQFVGKLTMNCLSVFEHFVGLALKGLRFSYCTRKYTVMV